jgi:hypothetical protein
MHRLKAGCRRSSCCWCASGGTPRGACPALTPTPTPAAAPAARITIDGILQHPWMARPLPPKYQKALDELLKDQHRIDITAMSGQFRNKSRDAVGPASGWLAAAEWVGGGVAWARRPRPAAV